MQRMNPNRAKFWKRRIPPSLRAAVDESLAYAKEARNLGVERIADDMGYDSHWTLYKQLADLRLPISGVRMFQNACGIDLISRYFASGNNRVSIEIPVGRTASADDIQALQEATNQAVGALLAFYAGRIAADETLDAIVIALQELASHRENVTKHSQPELEFPQ